MAHILGQMSGTSPRVDGNGDNARPFDQLLRDDVEDGSESLVDNISVTVPSPAETTDDSSTFSQPLAFSHFHPATTDYLRRVMLPVVIQVGDLVTLEEMSRWVTTNVTDNATSPPTGLALRLHNLIDKVTIRYTEGVMRNAILRCVDYAIDMRSGIDNTPTMLDFDVHTKLDMLWPVIEDQLSEPLIAHTLLALQQLLDDINISYPTWLTTERLAVATVVATEDLIQLLEPTLPVKTREYALLRGNSKLKEYLNKRIINSEPRRVTILRETVMEHLQFETGYTLNCISTLLQNKNSLVEMWILIKSIWTEMYTPSMLTRLESRFEEQVMDPALRAIVENMRDTIMTEIRDYLQTAAQATIARGVTLLPWDIEQVVRSNQQLRMFRPYIDGRGFYGVCGGQPAEDMSNQLVVAFKVGDGHFQFPVTADFMEGICVVITVAQNRAAVGSHPLPLITAHLYTKGLGDGLNPLYHNDVDLLDYYKLWRNRHANGLPSVSLKMLNPERTETHHYASPDFFEGARKAASWLRRPLDEYLV